MAEPVENPFPEPVEIEITDSLDLHSFSPKDIRAVVEAYLAEAHKKAFRLSGSFTAKASASSVRSCEKFCLETDFVRSFKNAPEFSGSWGATIAKLDV